MAVNRNWCDRIVPASFDEDGNPIGICCELLQVAEGRLIWREVETGLRTLPIQPQVPKPISVA